MDRSAPLLPRTHMDRDDTECVAHRCRQAANLEAPVQLCQHHLEVAWAFVAIKSDPQAARLSQPQPEQLELPAPPPSQDGWVYFIRFRDRVKIGWTGNLKTRMSNVPHSEILHTQPGTRADERRCHVAFAHLRDHGEWFRPGRDLIDFIVEIGGDIPVDWMDLDAA